MVLRPRTDVRTPELVLSRGQRFAHETTTSLARRGAALVFINGSILGVHRRPAHFAATLRKLRRRGCVGPYVSVFAQQDCVYLASDGGRVCRPLIVCDAGRPPGHLGAHAGPRSATCCIVGGATLSTPRDDETACLAGFICSESAATVCNLQARHVCPLWCGRNRSHGLCRRCVRVDQAVKDGRMSFNDFLRRGLIEYVDVNEENNSLIALYERDCTTATTHLEIEPFTVLGVVAGLIPYPHHNQSPRNTYQVQCPCALPSVLASGYQCLAPHSRLLQRMFYDKV